MPKFCIQRRDPKQFARMLPFPHVNQVIMLCGQTCHKMRTCKMSSTTRLSKLPNSKVFKAFQSKVFCEALWARSDRCRFCFSYTFLVLTLSIRAGVGIPPRQDIWTWVELVLWPHMGRSGIITHSTCRLLPVLPGQKWQNDMTTRLPANCSDLQYKEDTSLRNSECSRSATLLALISSVLHRKLRLTLSCRTCRCKLIENKRCRNTTIQHQHQHLFCFFASNIPETNAHACNVAVAGCCWMLSRAWDGVGGVAKDRSWRHYGDKLISAHLSQPQTPVTPKISSSPTCLQRSISNFDTPSSGTWWLTDNWQLRLSQICETR